VTELAYLVDPPAAYVRSFRATVTALPPGGIVLDRTFFYPTGGGQPNDRGTLRGGGASLEVVDVAKSGASVVHRVKAPAAAMAGIRIGSELEGTIDWERRHRHMRLHTGQHLLSARIFTRARLRTRRASLGGSEASLDLEGPLAADRLDELAGDLREAVERPRPVSIRYVPRAEWDRNPAAERSGLVPLPPFVDPVRVVEIDATDVCPCGGTHLRSTAEIGTAALRLERGGERILLTLLPDAPATPAP
jgi:misacylated tRNA(Ala) deacylase